MSDTDGFMVQPEGEPGHGHRHGAGHVDRHDEEGELPGKGEVDLEAGVLSGGSDNITIVMAVAAKFESSRQRQIARDLDWTVFIPTVNKVILRPTI